MLSEVKSVHKRSPEKTRSEDCVPNGTHAFARTVAATTERKEEPVQSAYVGESEVAGKSRQLRVAAF